MVKSDFPEFPEGDNEFEDGILVEVRQEGSGWCISRANDGSFSIMPPGDALNPDGVVPQVGDRCRFYGKGFGYPVRGVFLNGKRVYYRTVAEEKDRNEEWNRKRLAYERATWLAEKPERDANVAAMPPVFQHRIEGFRTRRPDKFWEVERYETFCCSEAVKIATEAQKHEKPLEWIHEFHETEYDEQRKLLPTLDENHSGNTFGTACSLASYYLRDPELVPRAHGAMCPLLGCKEYGCYASTEEAKAAREAEVT